MLIIILSPFGIIVGEGRYITLARLSHVPVLMLTLFVQQKLHRAVFPEAQRTRVHDRKLHEVGVANLVREGAQVVVTVDVRHAEIFHVVEKLGEKV